MVVRQKKIKLDYDDFPVKSDGDTIKLEKEEEKFIDSPDVEGQPHDWRLTYDLLQAYRASHVAPVDTMGCTLLSPVGEVPENLKRFHILLGLLLSSQTKDQITHDAMFRLHNYCKPALVSPESLLMIDESKLADLLKPVGFFKKKATYIRLLSEKLVADYEGQVPTKFEKIMAFTGIGPKMAYLYMNSISVEPLGIGVDVHVDRICRRLGWVKAKKSNSRTPEEETRLSLQSWLPKSLWKDINPLMVGYGQLICTAKPKCGNCVVANYCPSARKYCN